MTVLAPVTTMPVRYKAETEPDYNMRVYRWRIWASHEPRPDLWYASEDEIRRYKQWKDSE